MIVEMYVALIALATIFSLGVVAVFYPQYDDNLAQRVGIAIACLAFLALARDIWDRQSVTPALLWSILGAWCFTVGTALKVWKFRTRKPTGKLHLG